MSSEYVREYSFFPIPPLYWGAEYAAGTAEPLPHHTGNLEAGEIIRDGSLDVCHWIVNNALDVVSRIFGGIDHPNPSSRIGLVDLSLSSELAKWKAERQRLEGRVPPSKGKEVTELVGCSEWPLPC